MTRMISNWLQRLRRDDRGSYLIEFAFLCLPMFTMIMGITELGYMSYVKSRTEGTLRSAARLTSTGELENLSQVNAWVTDEIQKIVGAEATVSVLNYDSFDSVQKPEPFDDDSLPSGGRPNVGECFLDINANGQWDADRGSSGVGGSEDIVLYGVDVTYPMMFPLVASLVGADDQRMEVTAGTVLKNEPYGPSGLSPTTGAEICVTSANMSSVNGQAAD